MARQAKNRPSSIYMSMTARRYQVAASAGWRRLTAKGAKTRLLDPIDHESAYQHAREQKKKRPDKDEE